VCVCGCVCNTCETACGGRQKCETAERHSNIGWTHSNNGVMTFELVRYAFSPSLSLRSLFSVLDLRFGLLDLLSSIWVWGFHMGLNEWQFGWRFERFYELDDSFSKSRVCYESTESTPSLFKNEFTNESTHYYYLDL